MKNLSLSTALVAVATILGGLAALVYVASKGQDTSGILAVVTPVLSAMFVAAKLDGQAPALGRIDANVNGKLDGRIRDAVHAVLDERSAATNVVKPRP